MAIAIEQLNGRIVVRFLGRLGGPVSDDLRRQIRELLVPEGEVILDFSGVTELTSMALRRLLLLSRYGRALGCRLFAEGVPADLMGMVSAAGFLPMFQQVSTIGDIPLVHTGLDARIDSIPTRQIRGYGVRRGAPIPLGATLVSGGVNFSVFARHAERVTLILHRPGIPGPLVELPIPEEFRIGDIWAMTVFDLDVDDIEYTLRVDGPWAPELGHRYQSEVTLVDPLAQSLAGLETWAKRPTTGERRPLRGRIVPHDFDWNGDLPLQIAVEDLVIYELHVRGFTRSPTSGTAFPGTFAGLREKIPYLKELGINCVELMPIFEFDECENEHVDPTSGQRLLNYWGYSTVGFCAPKAGYAATSSLGLQADELKALVMDLHRHGIEVILDVVFNHTAELGEGGPTLSFRGLDNSVYYMLTPDGEYLNFSGCGNTVNCNHPVVREFVRTCLRHWVTEYHIDGFRFDLASIMGRDSTGKPLSNPPLLESLARDPVLSRTKLIAEAWDAGGLYQVGSFPSFGRWMEWNGQFRDTTRRFLRGDPGQTGEMVQRLIGSPDLYPERGPTASVNFVTCHDGFTLADLVSYEQKHNEANGEANRDGTDANFAWNCGVEGPTTDPAISALRLRQQKNALALLFLSQGVPMLLMGDEIGRTQQGNNNAYCHDSPLTWFDWSLREPQAELFRFCQGLIAFRKRHPALRHHMHAGRRQTQSSDLLDVTWHGVEPFQPDWSNESRTLACMLRHYTIEGLNDVVYVVFNMFWEPLTFRLPAAPDSWRWRKYLDTALPPPADVVMVGDQPEVCGPKIEVAGRSTVVLVAGA